jgi:hypothetical protein
MSIPIPIPIPMFMFMFVLPPKCVSILNPIFSSTKRSSKMVDPGERDGQLGGVDV